MNTPAGPAAALAQGSADDIADPANAALEAKVADDAPGPPPPSRPRASLPMVVLAVLAVGYTLWAAQALLLPVLLAMFFALVGNPIIRLLRRMYVPRFVGALFVLFVGMYGTYVLVSKLAEPAIEWMAEAPRELRQLSPKLQELTRPVKEANEAAEDIARAAGGEEQARPVEVVRTEVDDPYAMLMATPKAIVAVLTVLLLTFFFMVYGGRIQRNAIALLPSRQQKKVTVDILQSMELEISRYVLTISVINVVVGVVFALLMTFVMKMPLDEALLWGTMAALLNFAPYVGPLIGMLVMLMVGFVGYDELWQQLLPGAMYLGLHTLEGQFITPIVLGARMALSPLILILALMVFGWLWGIIGLLLAVPLLVCFKLVLSRIEGGEGWAKLLE